MNISFEGISSALEGASGIFDAISTISIDTIVSIVFLVFIAWEFLAGFRRGVLRQLLHTGVTIASAVAAYMATEYALEYLVAGIGDHTINDFLMQFAEKAGPLGAFIPYITFAEWFLVLPASTVLAPTIVTILFVVINLVAKFACGIVCIVVPKCRAIPFSRLIGGALGALAGVVVATMILFPAIATIDIAEETVDVIREKDDGKFTEVLDAYDSVAEQITNNTFFKFVNDNFGKKIVNDFATITVEGEETNLIEELDGVIGIVIDITKINPKDYVSLSEEQKALITAAADTVEESEYLMTVVACMFSDLGHAAEGGAFPIKIDSSYESIIHSVFHVFATSTRENLNADIDTLLEVYFLLSDSGSLKAFGTEGGEEDFKQSLIKETDGTSVVTTVVNKLNENEHMKPVVTAITEMTIKMLAGQLGMDYDTLNAYNEIKDGINGVLEISPENYETQEEYEEARDTEINNVLTSQGVELDDETINEIGDYIDENYSEIDHLDENAINDILLYYFETLGQPTTETPEVPEIPENPAE